MLNNHQLSELTDYLTANGFEICTCDKESNVYSFRTENELIIICGDHVCFQRWNNISHKWHIHQEFTGIGLLTLVHWMMLLHITGMVALKDFSITELESEIEGIGIAKANGKSASDTLQDLFRSFAPDLPH